MGAKQEKQKAEQIARLESQLREKAQQLQQQEAQAQQAQGERTQLESTVAELQAQRAERINRLQETEEAAASSSENDAQRDAELAARVTANQKLAEELEDAKRQLEMRTEAQEAFKKQLAQSEQQAEEKQKAILELKEQYDTQKGQLNQFQGERRDKAAQVFLDVSISGCEFASPFAYSIQFQLKGQGEVRHTDVSLSSARPVFNITSVLLPTDPDVANDVLQVSVFASIVDPVATGAPPIAKLLGEASVRLSELSVSEGATSSRRVNRSIEFVRKATGESQADAGKQIIVGRASVGLQARVLTPSEVAGAETARPRGSEPAASSALAVAAMDRSLWTAAPFQHRICALVHHAEGLPPPPEDGRSTARIALRLRRLDGQVLYESLSADVPLVPSGDATSMTSASFAQELVVPLKRADSSLEIQVQLALEVISMAAGASGATTAVLLDLHWAPDALPYFKPLHLHAQPSDPSSKASSVGRSRPSVLVSLVHEPAHDDLDNFGDGVSQGVEVRIHGIPVGRPLPDPIEDAILALSPEPASATTSDLQIPVATFFYDQPLDLRNFMESHFRSSSGKGATYFLTPVSSASSRTPQWGQFLMRFMASPAAFSSISLLLFQNGGGRADPDVPLGSNLLGFAALDARVLRDSLDGNVGTPPHRSYLLDLRLLESPGAGVSLELECRVWPRGKAPIAEMQPSPSAHAKHDPVAPSNAPGGGRPRVSNSPIGVANDVLGQNGIASMLGQEAHEFRLDHELSVQLAKEFNLRAAALKKAGEEIVSLRRQVQLLQAENTRLKSQLEEEERLAIDVQNRPLPEGFDRLSSAELASKLQRVLEKYREEKSKGAELGHRLEEAIKEASRGRGYQRSLDELETAHLQQNREMQRLQEENKKIDGYRQAAKTQEKVIAKLEKILEGSLEEVQKAQRVQVDMERLKTENLRLREKCAQLAARRRGAIAGGEDTDDLQRQLDEKDREVAKLEAIARELRANQSAPAPAAAPSELVEERRKLGELQDSRVEWEERCLAAEQRLTMLQQQLVESSKRYGGEITALQVEVAKREAKVLELEFLLQEKGVIIPAASPTI